MTEWLGWAATAVFVLSYFCARPQGLRAMQMIGALMWVAYGVLIGAPPVVAANVLVCGAAGWTVARSRSRTPSARAAGRLERLERLEIRAASRRTSL